MNAEYLDEVIELLKESSPKLAVTYRLEYSSVNKLWISAGNVTGKVAYLGDIAYHTVLPKVTLLIIILTLVQSDVAQAYSRDAILDRFLNRSMYF